MAMKKCKECWNEISSSAKICPNCGKKQFKVLPLIIIDFIIIFIGSLAVGGTASAVDPTTGQPVVSQENFTFESHRGAYDDYNISFYIDWTIKTIQIKLILMRR